jgi:YVTN family beta-propeller protein
MAATGSDNTLEFRVLGPLEVARGGGVVELGARRQRALLALLLLRPNQVVSSDRLIDELWGDSAPETATTALHGAVSQLRKVLEPGRAAGAPGAVLVTRSPGYQLRLPAEALDAARFERLLEEGRELLAAGEAAAAATALREALALWRGSAYADVGDDGAIRIEALRLEELRLEALEERIEADLALGRHEQLVSELEALVEREPLRERLCGQLMLALYRAGRQAESLDLYQRTRTRFVDELGIEPTARLRELEQAMLRQDPELDAGLPRLRPPAALRRRPGRLAAALAAVVVVAAAGVAALVFLRGDDAQAAVPPNTVAVIDLDSAEVTDTVPVGMSPSAIAYGHGSLWVANTEDETVSRIDPETRQVVATIGTGAAVDVAIGPDAVWVANGIDGTVSRIDPASNDRVATLDLRGDDPIAPRTINSVAFGAGAVWAAAVGRHLLRIDPGTNAVTASVDLGVAPLGLDVGEGAVWVVTAAFKLLRIEPSSGATTGQTPIGQLPYDVAVTDEGVAVLAGGVWLVDPESTKVVTTVAPGGFSTAVADVSGVGGWVGTADGAIVRIDLGLTRPPDTLLVQGQPSGLAVVDGRLWAAVRER